MCLKATKLCFTRKFRPKRFHQIDSRTDFFGYPQQQSEPEAAEHYGGHHAQQQLQGQQGQQQQQLQEDAARPSHHVNSQYLQQESIS
jgi:hypothetical protein